LPEHTLCPRAQARLEVRLVAGQHEHRRVVELSHSVDQAPQVLVRPLGGHGEQERPSAELEASPQLRLVDEVVSKLEAGAKRRHVDHLGIDAEETDDVRPGRLRER
jgi:hypothetical protein